MIMEEEWLTKDRYTYMVYSYTDLTMQYHIFQYDNYEKRYVNKNLLPINQNIIEDEIYVKQLSFICNSPPHVFSGATVMNHSNLNRNILEANIIFKNKMREKIQYETSLQEFIKTNENIKIRKME